MEALPDNWADIQPDTVYLSISGLLVSFASEQIKLGLKYDQKGKHLKAIEKGLVPLAVMLGWLLPRNQATI